jgi:hypothetical protein
VSNLSVENFSWSCSFCGRDATIASHDGDFFTIPLSTENVDKFGRLDFSFIVCPSPDCKKASLNIELRAEDISSLHELNNKGEILRDWMLIPESSAQNFPDYIPEAIRQDYYEACLIKNLSPKASATLSRRCLQGILRDFWEIKPGRLIDEIEAIKDQVDPLIWDAIDSVRTVGNIGAHMERDINSIVEVDPNEAGLLIGLLELLLKETYVSRNSRKEQLVAVKAMASQKTVERGKEVL